MASSLFRFRLREDEPESDDPLLEDRARPLLLLLRFELDRALLLLLLLRDRVAELDELRSRLRERASPEESELPRDRTDGEESPLELRERIVVDEPRRSIVPEELRTVLRVLPVNSEAPLRLMEA